MITKAASAAVASIAKQFGKDMVSPTNLALNSFLVTSGSSSLGEAAGMSAGGLAASKAYDAASSRFLPKAMAAAGRLPGIAGRVAKGVVGFGNLAGSLIAPTAAATASGSLVNKFAPVFKRKNPLPAHLQA